MGIQSDNILLQSWSYQGISIIGVSVFPIFVFFVVWSDILDSGII